MADFELVVDSLERPELCSPEPGRCFAAAHETGIVTQLLDRVFLPVAGPDAREFLHRLSSAEVLELGPGQGRWNCVLTGKGKLLAHFFQWCVGDESFLLEVDGSRREALAGFLEQYHFAERLELGGASAERVHVGGFGPRYAGESEAWIGAIDGGWEIRSAELGVPARRWLVAESVGESVLSGELSDGAVLAGTDVLEGLRIESGGPRFGLDVDEKTLPLEVGLEAACSTTKGCYPGQEVVARIHTYGHVNRSLVRGMFRSAESVAPGTAVFDEGMQAGRLTSCWRVPGGDEHLALVMLPMGAIEDAEELRVVSEEGPGLEVRGLVELR